MQAKTDHQSMRPLYQQAAMYPGKRPADANTGLWFDKFCNTWQRSKHGWKMSTEKAGANPKLCWLKTVCTNKVGNHKLIGEHIDRKIMMIERLGGRWQVFRSCTRFVTGLGRSHPVENGFAWHSVLGTAYLPGSSIKGLVSDWVRAAGVDDSLAPMLFGKRDARGAVCFLDAVPVEPVTLEADVMTPHYAGWDPQKPPGDWRSPKPIPFLTVAPGAAFLFGIVALTDEGRKRLDGVLRWLAEALRDSGAGAKTAVGYGRMEPGDPDAVHRVRVEYERRRRELEQRLAEQQRLASLSPLDRELDQLAQQPQYRGKPPYTCWLNELKTGRWQDDPDTQRTVAERVRDAMQQAGKWKPKSFAKNPQKDRDHQRTLDVLKFLGEAE